LPLALAAAAAASAVLGVLAGCFLPVPIYRLSTDRTGEAHPVTLPSGRCTHPNLARPDGWLRLGNACPRCHQRVGPATATTAIASGAVYAVITIRFLHSPPLPGLLICGLLAVAAAFVDLRCHRLPDRVVLPAGAVCAVTVVAAGFVQGDQHRTVRAFSSRLSVGAGLLVLAISTQAIGMGDVKTGAWVAMLAGWQGPTTVLVAAVGPFLLQAPIALALLIAGRVNRRSTLPFGPAILLAGLTSLVLSPGG
jgi:leader peptidase (prepilin peptidase) / N-methyltransferase